MGSNPFRPVFGFWILILSPLSLSRDKTVDTLLTDRADVPEMCISMDGVEELQLFTCFRFTAFPAPGNLFFLAALPDFAERRASAIPASLFAPELHHGTEQIVALRVMHKGFSKRGFCNDICKFPIFCLTKFLAKIPCKVSDFSRVPVAVKAAEAAVCNDIEVFFFHIIGVFSCSFKDYPRGEKIIQEILQTLIACHPAIFQSIPSVPSDRSLQSGNLYSLPQASGKIHGYPRELLAVPDLKSHLRSHPQVFCQVF